MVLLDSCLVWFATRESVIGYWYIEQEQCFYKVVNRIPAAEYPGEPIVIAAPLMAPTFRHDAPCLASRVCSRSISLLSAPAQNSRCPMAVLSKSHGARFHAIHVRLYTGGSGFLDSRHPNVCPNP
jgi:hypothetical protein